MQGEPMLAASAKTTIDREDWGTTWRSRSRPIAWADPRRTPRGSPAPGASRRDGCRLGSSRRNQMTTAIIGVGNIGKSVARHLVDGGERVVLAARDESNATAL